MAARAAQRSGVGGLVVAVLVGALLMTDAGRILFTGVAGWAGDVYTSVILRALDLQH